MPDVIITLSLGEILGLLLLAICSMICFIVWIVIKWRDFTLERKVRKQGFCKNRQHKWVLKDTVGWMYGCSKCGASGNGTGNSKPTKPNYNKERNLNWIEA